MFRIIKTNMESKLHTQPGTKKNCPDFTLFPIQFSYANTNTYRSS